MSIRFHKGPSIITLFHDSSSATSKQVLQLLTSYNNPHRPSPAVAAAGSGSGSHGESCIIEANGSGSDPTHTSNATSYLRNLASDPPSTPAIQLEIVDRKANPPTPDQLRSIVDYLATTTTTTTTDSTSTSSNDSSKQSPRYTTSGFDLAQHERRRKNLAQHLKSEGSQDGMPKIKDGPLVVNWDEGSAATSLEGVKQMLMRLERNNANEGRGEAGKDSGGCIVC